MKNMIDYVRDAGNFGFDEKPFCAADSVVLAQLSYLQFGNELSSVEKPRAAVRLAEYIPLRGIRALVEGTFMPSKNEKLLLTILESGRFREIRAYAHVAELDQQTQKQFSATTFLLPTASICGFPRNGRHPGRVEGRSQHGFSAQGARAGIGGGLSRWHCQGSLGCCWAGGTPTARTWHCTRP